MKPIETVVPPRCHHCYFKKVKDNATLWHCEYDSKRDFDEPCDKYDEGICPRARGNK